MFSFWSLNRIIEEFVESENKNIIGFCDFLIMSHVIGFKRNAVGIFNDYSTDYEPIALTFMEAIGMINSGSREIY